MHQHLDNLDSIKNDIEINYQKIISVVQLDYFTHIIEKYNSSYIESDDYFNKLETQMFQIVKFVVN